MAPWNQSLFVFTVIQAFALYNLKRPSLYQISPEIWWELEEEIQPNMIRSIQSFVGYRKRKANGRRARRKLSRYEKKFIREFSRLYILLNVTQQSWAVNITCEGELMALQSKKYSLISKRLKTNATYDLPSLLQEKERMEPKIMSKYGKKFKRLLHGSEISGLLSDKIQVQIRKKKKNLYLMICIETEKDKCSLHITKERKVVVQINSDREETTRWIL